jgi:SPP1 family predicted phage head-tail adaptor
VKIGNLNNRITIQSRTAGEDEAGQPLLTWTDVATVWANVAGQTGLGTIKNSGDVTAAIKAYSFRIRFREGIDEGMRVLYSATPFDVKQVRMDYAGREWTDLVCEQGGSDG